MVTYTPHRVIAYIDGFKLYYGLRDSQYRRFYWLDMPALARNLLHPGQVLARTKYFTARIAGPKPVDSPHKAQRIEEKRRRQSDYLDALETLPELQIYLSHYLAKSQTCRQCKSQWTSHEEKMTGVCIATEMLVDAFHDRFDMALLISADSDLTPPVHAIRKLLPAQRIVAAFPPKRSSSQLKQAVHACFTIGRNKLLHSQLPAQVILTNGHVLTRPAKWQ